MAKLPKRWEEGPSPESAKFQIMPCQAGPGDIFDRDELLKRLFPGQRSNRSRNDPLGIGGQHQQVAVEQWLQPPQNPRHALTMHDDDRIQTRRGYRRRQGPNGYRAGSRRLAIPDHQVEQCGGAEFVEKLAVQKEGRRLSLEGEGDLPGAAVAGEADSPEQGFRERT